MSEVATPLATSVVGSWPVPPWMQHLATDAHRGRVSPETLTDVHEVAIRAAIKDQELAGLDVVSDGELRRDNDVDHLLARVPGVRLPTAPKSFHADYYDARVDAPLPPVAGPVLGLGAEFAFARDLTDRPVKVSLTGPFSLALRLGGDGYPDRAGLVRDLARVLHAEAADLVARGAEHLQIDEPFLAGHRDQVRLAVEAVDLVARGVDARWGLHVCYGRRYARPAWEGHYDFLFPAVLDAPVDELVLELARGGDDDLPVITRWDRAVGMGVVDVRDPRVESVDTVAARIRAATSLVDPARLTIVPDCGLRPLTADAARGKLRAMVAATAAVRAEITDTAPEPARV